MSIYYGTGVAGDAFCLQAIWHCLGLLETSSSKKMIPNDQRNRLLRVGIMEAEFSCVTCYTLYYCFIIDTNSPTYVTLTLLLYNGKKFFYNCKTLQYYLLYYQMFYLLCSKLSAFAALAKKRCEVTSEFMGFDYNSDNQVNFSNNIKEY